MKYRHNSDREYSEALRSFHQEPTPQNLEVINHLRWRMGEEPLLPCPSCHLLVTNDVIVFRENNHNYGCNNCSYHCEFCELIFGQQYFDNHSNICNLCGKLICERCWNACDGCGQTTCNDCLKVIGTEVNLCEKCIARHI